MRLRRRHEPAAPPAPDRTHTYHARPWSLNERGRHA